MFRKADQRCAASACVNCSYLTVHALEGIGGLQKLLQAVDLFQAQDIGVIPNSRPILLSSQPWQRKKVRARFLTWRGSGDAYARRYAEWLPPCVRDVLCPDTLSAGSLSRRLSRGPLFLCSSRR